MFAVADEANPKERPRLIDWVVTPPFLVSFGLTLLVFDPLQRVARLFGQRPQEVVANALQWTLVWCFRIAGTRFEVERSPKVRPKTRYLVIANHQSMFDIPILGSLLFSNYTKYVSKRSLAKRIPSISYNLRAGGHALIDRSDRESATRAIRELGEQTHTRLISPVIYPEGTRARTGELGRFRPAGALALLESAPDVEVIPVVIDNSWRLLRWSLFPIPFGTCVHVRIGEPIARKPDEDRKAILASVRGEIGTTLEGWRSG
jgi:1-acyl-sn-glycerol-3-phosphate acyltransferase